MKFELQFFGGRGASSNNGSSKYSQTVKRIENRIRNDSIETAAVVDQQGNVLFEKSNNKKDGVFFTKEETAKMQDSILTHNHPMGTTFSSEDIDITVKRGIKEIRATHANGTYSLTRDYNLGDQIPSKYMNFSKDYEQSVKNYARDVVDDMYNRTGDADKCNKMISDYKRKWLKDNSKSYGFTYKEESQ